MELFLINEHSLDAETCRGIYSSLLRRKFVPTLYILYKTINFIIQLRNICKIVLYGEIFIFKSIGVNLVHFLNNAVGLQHAVSRTDYYNKL